MSDCLPIQPRLFGAGHHKKDILRHDFYVKTLSKNKQIGMDNWTCFTGGWRKPSDRRNPVNASIQGRRPNECQEIVTWLKDVSKWTSWVRSSLFPISEMPVLLAQCWCRNGWNRTLCFQDLVTSLMMSLLMTQSIFMKTVFESNPLIELWSNVYNLKIDLGTICDAI